MVKLEDFDFKGFLPIFRVFVDDRQILDVPLGSLDQYLLCIFKCNPKARVNIELLGDKFKFHDHD